MRIKVRKTEVKKSWCKESKSQKIDLYIYIKSFSVSVTGGVIIACGKVLSELRVVSQMHKELAVY